MKALKNNYNTCNNCFAQISLGQSNATKYAYGQSLCVHCSSNNDKFESVITNHMSLYRGTANKENMTYAE